MKIEITFKSPDGVDNAVEEAAMAQLGQPNLDDPDTGDDDRDLLNETKSGIMSELCQWLRFGEMVTIVFDTEAKTATVKDQNA